MGPGLACTRIAGVSTNVMVHMQESLKGSGKTLMLVNVAPGDDNASESLCSLQFAARVRGVELGPSKRNVESGAELKGLREEVQRLKAEVTCGLTRK